MPASSSDPRSDGGAPKPPAVQGTDQAREAMIANALEDIRRLFHFAVSENRLPTDKAGETVGKFVKLSELKISDIKGDNEKILWDLFAELTRFVVPATPFGLQKVSELEDDQRKRPGIFRNWRKDPETRRMVRRAWIAMLLTLMGVIVFQIYSLIGSGILQEIEKRNAVLEQVRREESQIRVNTNDETKPPLKEVLERKREITQRLLANYGMLNTWNKAWRALFNMVRSVPGLMPILNRPIPGSSPPSTGPGSPTPPQQAVVNEQAARAALQAISLYLLPMLYGLLGASVFILRRVGHELEALNFARGAPSRHRLRYALGAVLGATAGLIFTPTGVGTPDSPLQLAAVAFVAGFSVEAVFSQMDALIGALRKKTQEPTTPAKS